MILLLLACRDQNAVLEIVDGDPSATADECSVPCFTVSLSNSKGPLADTQVRFQVDHPGRPIDPIQTDADGLAEVCPVAGALQPESTSLTIMAANTELTVDLDVRAFGYSLGRERDAGMPTEITRFPSFQNAPAPLLVPAEGAWYARHLTSPAPLGDSLVYFSGSSEGGGSKNPFQIGVATLDHGVVVDMSDPIIPADAWDAESQNDPTVVFDGTTYVLLFDGRATADSPPAIGRATSTDGYSFTTDPAPVYTGLEGAGHPGALLSDDGFVEMWTSYLGAVDFAISADNGATFTAYCQNPVVPVDGDLGFKTPQVAWDGERYLMTLAVGPSPNYSLQWYESTDGLRWLAADEPVLSPSASGWDDTAVADGQVVFDEAGGMHLWYAGNSETSEPSSGAAVIDAF